ncbi:MAG: class I SAM-dependent methyltransferase [Phycisphaeraceae bacterium]|nr:class I SAM-dependent methyltransferase [Phycisphaerales bacterium]MCB9860656.1 class I SAM-dependent methyltransferase [Phycisphaeraceae bacterium]
MPSLDENLTKWTQHGWPMDGDEWSTLGGGSFNWWHGLILPRLAPSLHAISSGADALHCDRILEIAPGHGRWTQFLLNHCDHLIGVDLVDECTQHCARIFASHPTQHEFHTNDGRTLPMVADASIDLVFSWDSLVHAELDVIESYLRECRRVLRTGGRAFLHHSNLAQYKDVSGNITVDRPHWRAESVSASMVDAICGQLGITCVNQEVITKGQQLDDGICIDCVTVIENTPPAPGHHTWVVRNGSFWREIHAMGRVRKTYDLASFPEDKRPT